MYDSDLHIFWPVSILGIYVLVYTHTHVFYMKASKILLLLTILICLAYSIRSQNVATKLISCFTNDQFENHWATGQKV